MHPNRQRNIQRTNSRAVPPPPPAPAVWWHASNAATTNILRAFDCDAGSCRPYHTHINRGRRKNHEIVPNTQNNPKANIVSTPSIVTTWLGALTKRPRKGWDPLACSPPTRSNNTSVYHDYITPSVSTRSPSDPRTHSTSEMAVVAKVNEERLLAARFKRSAPSERHQARADARDTPFPISAARESVGKLEGVVINMSCMAAVLWPYTLASLQCRDEARRGATGGLQPHPSAALLPRLHFSGNRNRLAAPPAA